ncbi:MAG: hypothetical protein QXM31_03320 [Candidatus Woesearchaeota archaeon]
MSNTCALSTNDGRGYMYWTGLIRSAAIMHRYCAMRDGLRAEMKRLQSNKNARDKEELRLFLNSDLGNIEERIDCIASKIIEYDRQRCGNSH